jgi:hypothetical protein
MESSVEYTFLKDVAEEPAKLNRDVALRALWSNAGLSITCLLRTAYNAGAQIQDAQIKPKHIRFKIWGKKQKNMFTSVYY